MLHTYVKSRWPGATIIVAAPGPSLPESASFLQRAFGVPIIAVSNAYRVLRADIVYACGADWWQAHSRTVGYAPERWSTHNEDPNVKDHKRYAALSYNINLVQGRHQQGFSSDPRVVHYGLNSGFQAVNLAMHLGATRIALVGFDMQTRAGSNHFDGMHPPPLRNTQDYDTFINAFKVAMPSVPEHIEIVNCTPNSALTCFPVMELKELLYEIDDPSRSFKTPPPEVG